jgi:hypothetical protein
VGKLGTTLISLNEAFKDSVIYVWLSEGCSITEYDMEEYTTFKTVHSDNINTVFGHRTLEIYTTSSTHYPYHDVINTFFRKLLPNAFYGTPTNEIFFSHNTRRTMTRRNRGTRGTRGTRGNRGNRGTKSTMMIQHAINEDTTFIFPDIYIKFNQNATHSYYSFNHDAISDNMMRFKRLKNKTGGYIIMKKGILINSTTSMVYIPFYYYNEEKNNKLLVQNTYAYTTSNDEIYISSNDYLTTDTDINVAFAMFIEINSENTIYLRWNNNNNNDNDNNIFYYNISTNTGVVTRTGLLYTPAASE